MHILSPKTDNCPSWISGRERMTVENISWSISTKECCRPWQGLNPRPPGLQSHGASKWATEAQKVVKVKHYPERCFFFCFVFFFWLTFYFKWIYFVLIDHILSETLCLFHFCVLFSNIYLKIKIMVKNWSDNAISIVKWFFFSLNFI